MSKDSRFRRRMSINKFNNRPPFNLKKIDGSTSTDLGRKVASTQRDYCDGQDLSGTAKIFGKAAKHLEKIEDPYKKSMKNKNKIVIPKVIESFQKVTPKTRSKKIRIKQKSDSLHTLFRKNDTNLGKNIPNHKLMKKLLEDFDNKEAEVKDEDSCENIDVVPSKDTNRSCINNLTEVNIIRRVDKMTSTTGLYWPVTPDSKDNHQVDLKPSRMNMSNKSIDRTRTRIPQKKISVEKVDSSMRSNKCIKDNLKNVFESKRSLCSYELEYFPTKEVTNLQPKKTDCTSKIPTKQNGTLVSGLNKINFHKECPKYKFNSEHDDLNNEHSYTRIRDKNGHSDEKMGTQKKEKSFVRLQVEKYNKIYRTNNKGNTNPISRLPVTNNLKNFQEMKTNINKNYMNIMSNMRENLPQMRGDFAIESGDGSQQWSDNTIEIAADITFPKETRNAMEHMINTMTRIPLAKCIKNKNLQLHPAISINSQSRADYEECSTLFGASYTKVHQSPHTKNTFCDRACHGHEPSRYNIRRIRPNHKA